MRPARTLRASLLPLLLLASTTVNECEISTASGTGELRIVGTVRFVEREGGCWGLDADDGRSYELSADQAPPEVLRSGARVRLIVSPHEDAVGRCRMGTPVDVRRVELIQAPSASRQTPRSSGSTRRGGGFPAGSVEEVVTIIGPTAPVASANRRLRTSGGYCTPARL